MNNKTQLYKFMLKKWGEMAKVDAIAESQEWERMVNLVRALRGEK